MFIAPIIAAIIAFITTPIVIKLAHQHHLLDDPQKRTHPAHTHTGIIPRAGGLALFLAIVIPSMIFLELNQTLWGILLAAFVTILIGLWDDRVDLSPYARFIGNILTALLVVSAGVGIPFITNPFGGIIDLSFWQITFDFFGTHTVWVWSDLLAIMWIVWTMNIVGWSSGIDGQMPGFIAIVSIVLGIMSLRFSAHDISQTVVATLAFITAGAFLGFLPWNFYPQKIMPGYGGKTLAGFMIAVLAILSGNKVGSAILVLSIPMLDAFYTLFRRLKNKRSPFRGDREHLHHRLLDVGWGKRRIALFYWCVSAILGLLTLTFSSQQKLFAFLAIAVAVFGSLIWLSLWKKITIKND